MKFIIWYLFKWVIRGKWIFVWVVQINEPISTHAGFCLSSSFTEAVEEQHSDEDSGLLKKLKSWTEADGRVLVVQELFLCDVTSGLSESAEFSVN